jgi:hypothetical protein
MLMNRLFDSRREATPITTPGQPVTSVNVERPAANTSHWISGDGQARRLRRRRRMERSGSSPSTGWTVRTW